MSTNILLDKTAHSWLLHPVTYWILQNAVSIVVVGFTSPASSIRYAVLPPMLTFIWLLLPLYREQMQTKVQAGFLAVNTMMNVLQYIEMALLSKWSFETHSRCTTLPLEQDVDKTENLRSAKKDSNHGSFWQRLRFDYFAIFSTRLCGTRYEVKNIPHFDSRDPAYVPSRAKFLLQNLWTAVLCYLIVDFVASSADPAMNHIIYSASKVPLLTRIQDISGRELAIRLVSVLGVWAPGYFFLQLLLAVYTSARVACGLDQVEFWRPSFGPLSEAYSIRQFWSVFWHQHLRLRLSGLPNLLVHRILHLPAHSFLARYTHLLLVFLLSGLLHQLMDVAQGTPWRESGSLRFYGTTALGIMLEDGVQAIYRRAWGIKRGVEKRPRWGARLAGYVWTLAFMVWASPAWFYPGMREDRGEAVDRVLPFSFVKYLRG